MPKEIRVFFVELRERLKAEEDLALLSLVAVATGSTKEQVGDALVADLRRRAAVTRRARRATRGELLRAGVDMVREDAS